MIGVGLQHKSIKDLEKEIQLPPIQILTLFNKIVKKLISLLEINVNQMSENCYLKKKENQTESVDSIQNWTPGFR